MDLKYLGKRLKALRLSVIDSKTGKPLSQAGLAQLAGISRGSIQDAEKGLGKDGPCIATLDKWLTACDSNLKTFFGAPGRKDYNVPFDYDAQFEPLFVMLAEILNADRPELHQGVLINLMCISAEARRQVYPPNPQRHTGT